LNAKRSIWRNIIDNNVGNFDRIVRIIAGIALISLPLFAPELRLSYLGWLGIIPIVTAAVGYCPLYSILGVRTNAKGIG
jgi:Protein of unknown function (DUF2892)